MHVIHVDWLVIYPDDVGLVRMISGPNMFPSVCESRPLLACVTLARCVRRYCRVRRLWRGMLVERSRTRLTSLSWLAATAPSGTVI